MATPMNFQSLNYGGIAQQEQDARRRYYDSLSSIGGVIKDTGKEYEDYLARKKAEEDEKRKWDNMLAEQEYQKEQDRLNREHAEEREAIEDARVLRDWKLKQEELRNKTYKDMNDAAALEKYREGLKKSYTPEYLAKYGPTAQADYEAAMTAPTLAEAVASGRNLGQGIYQKDLMDFQREQNAANEKRTFAEERPNKITRSTLSNLTDKRIDISSGYLPTSKKEAERWLAEINAAIMAQNSITQDGVSEHSDFSSKVTSSLYSLQRRLKEFLGQTPNGY